MRPDGSGERLLTQAFLVEGPTWAPNGRVLMYFRQAPTDSKGKGGTPRLYSIDLTGYNEREAITPQDAADPAWSPFIPWLTTSILPPLPLTAPRVRLPTPEAAS